MRKHLYKPFEYSFSKGEQKTTSYKCQYCEVVVPTYVATNFQTKKNAICPTSKSKARYAEIVMAKYNCLEFDSSIESWLNEQIDIIGKKKDSMIKSIKLSILKVILNIYVRYLNYDMDYKSISKETL